MTTRKIGSTTYTQSFGVETRLIQVSASGSSQVTQFAYDASGQRLRTLVGTPGVSRTITTYPFPQYEVELRQSWEPCSGPCGGGDGGNWVTMATIIRRTYMLGGQAIATRITGDPTNNGLFYLHGDHLGSTSLLTYGSSPGHIVPGTEMRYLPYGTHRLAPTTQLTERDYTGQKENLELGLLYYNARFYVPGIGRFANADTIVPDPGNPQQLNRYAYVLNNSLRFTDPSGHVNCDGDSGDPNGACEFWINRIQTDVTQLFQFDAASSWLARELMELYLSLLQFATGPVNSSGFTPIQLIEYMLDYQSVTITRKSHAPHNPKALMSVTRTNTGIIKELTIYDRGLYHMTYDSRDRVWDRGGRRAHKDIAGSFAHEIGHIAVSRLGLNMGYYDQLLSRVHERDLQGVEIDKRGWSFNASRSPEEDFAELVSYNLCVNLCADLSYIRHPASGAGPGLVRQNVFNSWVNNGFLNSRNRGQ